MLKIRGFDSEMEVFEWSHSLYPEISNYLCIEESVGYATPDEKVITQLGELIPQWADYLKVKVEVHREKVLENGNYVYRIWTSKAV